MVGALARVLDADENVCAVGIAMDALTRLATTAVADPAVESAAKDVTVRARTALEDALAKTQLRCPDVGAEQRRKTSSIARLLPRSDVLHSIVLCERL